MRDFGRLREIAGILIHYGWGDIVKRMGLGNVVERAGTMLHPRQADEIMHLPPQVRVRMALQDLGPTFVKLGQVLATRPDIFPPSWIAEFSLLQDQVPPESFEALLPDMGKALGRSPFEVFQELQTEAIAGASIAQVHLAKLQDGTPVVLKVRRPNIEGRIEADLRLLSHLAHLLESELPEARRYSRPKSSRSSPNRCGVNSIWHWKGAIPSVFHIISPTTPISVLPRCIGNIPARPCW